MLDEHDRQQDILRCKAKIYKISKMQRCPYMHEMKERLLGEQVAVEVIPSQRQQDVSGGLPPPPPPPPEHFNSKNDAVQPVATIVKLNSGGYTSRTSPSHTHHVISGGNYMCSNEPFRSRSFRNNVLPKNAKTSLFIIMSFVYAKLLVVVCIAYVISDVITHNIPLWYYEGFFTYLYGISILFLLYVFCFLLQESACCNGEKGDKSKAAKEKAKEKAKEEKERKKREEKEKKDKEKKEKEKKNEKGDKKKDKDKEKDKKNEKGTYRRNSEGVVDAGLPVPVVELSTEIEKMDVVLQESAATAPPQTTPTPATNSNDVEGGLVVKGGKRKRKTTQNDTTHGSFFLRVGAIAFGLGTMIYSGLEFGSFFEIPFTSPCYMILRGINPVLQMVFTFMQMYFIFMNSRLNIHRFKVIARFGLMHIAATNICVWIRTVVLEYLKEVTVYHKKLISNFTESVRAHTLRNSHTILGTHAVVPDSFLTTTRTTSTSTHSPFTTLSTSTQSTLRDIFTTMSTTTASTTTTTTTTPMPELFWRAMRATPGYLAPVMTTNPTTTTMRSTTSLTTPSTTTTSTTTQASRIWNALTSTMSSSTSGTSLADMFNYDFNSNVDRGFENFDSNIVPAVGDLRNFEETNSSVEHLENIFPQSLLGLFTGIYNGSNSTGNDLNNTLLQASCGRINIMGTIVQDSTPYLFPFIVEYSLIGATVIYVMWKHIGRNPRYYNEEDLEHRLEVMLSRRAVAMAHAQNGKVDCVGASKGLFFGLLLLVGSLICLILFFVLIHHPDLSLLAIYLADVSHCALMALSIVAIIVGFIRVQSLKFKMEEQSDLNDILLRISAFGLFIYATFSIISGSLDAFTKEPNLLVMVTGILAVVQVVLQLLFIADVSRRRVHLPEHDRSKPGRQIVTFLLICNITMWIIYTFEAQKVEANPIQLEFFGFLTWAMIQRLTLPLCIFHRFHSAVTLAEIWKTSYKAHLD